MGFGNMLFAKPRRGASAVVAYKEKEYYKSINYYLRYEQFLPILTSTQQQLVLRYIRDLHGIMNMGMDPTLYPVLYRGTDYDEFRIRSKKYSELKRLEGQSYTWKSFVSTSTSRLTAERFNKGLIIIFYPSARTNYLDMLRYRDLTRHNFENEILLDYETVGTITAVSYFRGKPGKKPCAIVKVKL